VLNGTVTDSANPLTIAGSGFGMQGDGTPADSAVTEWQDFATTPTGSTVKFPVAGGDSMSSKRMPDIQTELLPR
ncbi:MAG: hypothetical protein ABR906_10190, partial [Terracidiphilus sp.]